MGDARVASTTCTVSIIVGEAEVVDGAAAFARSPIPVDINGLSSSFSFLLCHSNAETAQIVIIDELDSGLFKCRLNFDQS